MVSCFACFGPPRDVASHSSRLQPAVPPDHTELSREQLKELYAQSIALNSGRLIVHGIFARADTKNNNKRIYPQYLLKREVDKFEREHIAKGTALGELDHPNYASRYFKCLNLPNISHQVLEVFWKGDQLWGSIEILPTPSGLLLWELYSQGIKLGVSSRGWASLRTDHKKKCVFVDDDFELITFDFVTEPSTKDAYLVPIQQTWKLPAPNQRKVIQIAHLGHGTCSMDLVPELPQGSTLAARIGELEVEASKTTDAQAQAPVKGPDVSRARNCDQLHQPSKLQYLDKLLLYSHYIVHQDAPYLDRERDARNFQAHLAMFASRAHLSSQTLMNKMDLNALIMQEVSKQDVKLNGACHKLGPPQANKIFMHLAECQGQQLDDASSEGNGKKTRYHMANDPKGGEAPAAAGIRFSSRVHPQPPALPLAGDPSQPAIQQNLQPPDPPEAVLLELQRVKATLAKFSTVQQRMQQQYLRDL